MAKKAKVKANPSNKDKQILKLLEDIKRLLILQTIASGVQPTDISKVLKVNKSTITRLVPTRKMKIK